MGEEKARISSSSEFKISSSEFKSFYLVAIQPWVGYLVSICLSFLIYKTGTITYSFPQSNYLLKIVSCRIRICKVFMSTSDREPSKVIGTITVTQGWGAFLLAMASSNGPLEMAMSRQNLLFSGLLKDSLFWFLVLDRSIKFNSLWTLLNPCLLCPNRIGIHHLDRFVACVE